MEIAETMIKKLEKASHNREVDKHAKMTELTDKIKLELKTTIEEEEQLNQFSAALIKLGNEIRSTEES